MKRNKSGIKTGRFFESNVSLTNLWGTTGINMLNEVIKQPQSCFSLHAQCLAVSCTTKYSAKPRVNKKSGNDCTSTFSAPCQVDGPCGEKVHSTLLSRILFCEARYTFSGSLFWQINGIVLMLNSCKYMHVIYHKA